MIQDSANSSGAKVSPAHAPPRFPFEILMCAINLLSKLQLGGDNLVGSVFEVSQEKSRVALTSELGKFIHFDSQEAAKIGDCRRTRRRSMVSGPFFHKETFPNATICEEMTELTPRAEEAGMLRTFINTANVADRTW